MANYSYMTIKKGYRMDIRQQNNFFCIIPFQNKISL